VRESGLQPQVAVLIAAGVAALVNLAGLYIAHRLQLARERRSHDRATASDVVHRAALALATGSDGKDGDILSKAQPGSFSASHPTAVAVMASCFPLFEELAVVFGREDKLSVDYLEAVTARAQSRVVMDEALAKADKALVYNKDSEFIGDAATSLVAASRAAEAWLADAKRRVAQI
jgi:hypothetical protein